MIKPMVYPYFKHSEEAELGAEEMIRDIKMEILKWIYFRTHHRYLPVS